MRFAPIVPILPVALLAGLATAFHPGAASAQPPPPASPPAATPPIASVPPAAAAPAAPSTPATTPAPAAAPASAEAKEQARLHFTAGVNLLQDPEKPRYEEAYAEFRQAYDLVKASSILGNIGLCAMKLERDAEAIDAYARYLAEMSELAPAERAQIERDLVTLRAGLARVTVESHPDGALIRDTRMPVRGEPVTNVYGPIKGPTELGLRRGHHVIKASYADGVEASWELEVAGGETHVFERPAPQRSVLAPGPVEISRPIPASVYIGGIATLALAVGSGVTGALALNTRSRYETANDGTDISNASNLRSTGQTLDVVTDSLLGAAVVGAVVTTVLYLTRPSVQARSGVEAVVLPGGVGARF